MGPALQRSFFDIPQLTSLCTLQPLGTSICLAFAYICMLVGEPSTLMNFTAPAVKPRTVFIGGDFTLSQLSLQGEPSVMRHNRGQGCSG